MSDQIPDIEIDHIAVAVPGLDDPSYEFWKLLGWPAQPETEVVESQKVKVGFLPFQNKAAIELLEPTDDSSTIAKYLEKRGPGLHHICLRVKNIDSILKKLKSAQIRLINETAVPGADGCRVAFVHPSSTGGVLVELSEKSSS